MQPNEALETLEIALRRVIREVLGTAWINDVKDREVLEQRRETERKQRDGVLVSDDLLDYTMLYQLEDLISRNWQSFKEVFEDKKRFDVWMKEVDHVRNAIAHSRPLLPHEQELLSAISRQIRNLITIYRTNQMPVKAYYPLIEFVRDSFGQDGYEFYQRGVFMQPWNPAQVIRLSIGEPVRFTCQASDPHGRELEWRVVRGWDVRQDDLERPSEWFVGDSVNLEWTPTESEVGEEIIVYVDMRAKDSKFFRIQPSILMGGLDDIRAFKYAVNPPLP
jgi:hypothetical protein